MEMKKIALYFIIATLSLLGGVSCLKENNKSYPTDEDYFTDAMRLQTGVNGCYSPLRSILASRGFWEMTEVSCDLIYLSSASAYNSNCDVSPSRPAIASTIWQYGYSGVRNCNEMMADIASAVDKGYVTASDAAPLLAETAVMRSLYYYILTCSFGDVPFYTEKVTEDNRAAIARLPRMDAKATRDYLIDELKDYIVTRRCLDYIRTYDDGNYRFGAAVGLMLGAKLSMWNERWDDAIAFIDELEGIYGHYEDAPEQFGVDYPLSDVPFCNKYTPESILEVSNIEDAYGLKATGLIASVTTPIRKNVPVATASGDEETEIEGEEEETEETSNGTDFYAGIAIPELGGYARTSSSVRPNSYLYKQLLPYSGADLRSGEYSNGSSTPRGGSGVLAWRWSGYDLVNDPQRTERKVLYFWTSGTSQVNLSSTSRPWMGNKFWAYGMYNAQDPNNYKFFRFADALLMKAEALLKTDCFDEAGKYLSITRTRAGIGQITYANVNFNAEALMEEIRKERARELIGEFQRKFDLVRWGIWYERTVNYNEGQYIHDYIQPYHRYWPIPADQVSYSGNALDNKEYMQ